MKMDETLLYGEPLEKFPEGLFIPPDALKVFLESFQGPLDLLLYLIKKQNFDILGIHWICCWNMQNWEMSVVDNVKTVNTVEISNVWTLWTL